MKKAFIILVTPAPISNATSEENLGLGYLAAACRSKNIEVLIIDGWLEGLKPEEIAERIIDNEEPLFVGFSCYQLNKNLAIKTIEILKSRGFNAPFLAGGFGPTFSPEDFIKSGFDIISLCEGEEIIPKLCDYYMYGSPDIESIPGICYKDSQGNIYKNKPKLISDLDSLAYPSRDTMSYVIKENTPVDIISSRGCMGNCLFCSVAAFWRMAEGPVYRQRSLINVVDEIEELYKQGAWFFKFVDDSFIEPPRDGQWCKEFANEINRRGLDIRFRISMRADRVEDEMIEALCSCGLKSIQLGIENFTEESLQRMGKKAALQHNIRALEIIEKYKEKYGLCLQVGFILFDYGTTMDEIRENYKMLKKYSWAVTRGFTEMYAAVGTPYTKLLKNKGLIEGEEAYLQNYSYSVMDPDALKVYNALKEWHVNYVKLYDMTIDPITKPKALGDNGFKKFHSFYMEIKEREMQYFGEILDMVGRYKSQEEIDEYVKTSIENSKEWIRKMQERVNELYKSEDIYYLAVANPFMCKDPKKQ